MVEVVFDESSKASMKQSKVWSKETSLENNLLNEVLFIGGNLDMGDIFGEIDSFERRGFFEELWSDLYVDKKDVEKNFNKQHKDMDKLLEMAKKREAIRIWKGNSPASVCGFAFVCNILKDIDCKIKVISLPEYILRDDNIIESFIDFNSVSPNEFYKFLSYERELAWIEKDMYSSLWEELKLENSPLRAIVNGSLISVSEDFYDHIIIKNIPSGEFKMIELIGTVFGRYQIGVSDFWYVKRIKKMIQEGLIQVVFENNKNSWKYETVLRKK